MSDAPQYTPPTAGNRLDNMAGGALTVNTTRLVIYAAIVFVAALIFAHLRASLGGWMDWKPNDEGNYSILKKLTRVSSLLGIVEIILFYLAWALFIWACVRELSSGLARRA